MIQDIAPARFSVSYDLRPVKADSVVCAFRGPFILGGGEAGRTLELPRFCEVPAAAEDCWFLFSVSGRDYFWWRAAPRPAGGDYRWLPLRASMACAPQRDAFAALTARHLAVWYESNRFCGRCGRPMTRDGQERAMLCPRCGNLVYPRINPVIIVGVTDGDHLLVTKYAASHSATRTYALIAGFCEIGETAEDTVRREVWEEVGLHVKNIRYYASQPWGIDGNLSLGFFAELDGSDRIRLEEDELSQAQWLRREELPRWDNTLALTWEMMEAFRLGRL